MEALWGFRLEAYTIAVNGYRECECPSLLFLSMAWKDCLQWTSDDDQAMISSGCS